MGQEFGQNCEDSSSLHNEVWVLSWKTPSLALWALDGPGQGWGQNHPGSLTCLAPRLRKLKQLKVETAGALWASIFRFMVSPQETINLPLFSMEASGMWSFYMTVWGFHSRFLKIERERARQKLLLFMTFLQKSYSTNFVIFTGPPVLRRGSIDPTSPGRSVHVSL